MDSNTLTFAKVLVDSDGRSDCGITSDVYHEQLQKLALAQILTAEKSQWIF
jgi:hypothetical protein